MDRLIEFISRQINLSPSFELKRVTDYREKGRDETGYRGAHLILERDGKTLELQVRSRVQHYWAESIERSSIIYGHHLKEQEGHPKVINYFKSLSDIFYEIESGRDPDARNKVQLDRQREEAQEIIYASDKHRIFDSYVNEDVIQTLKSVEGGSGDIDNWIIVFDWKTGEFVTWASVSRNSEEAVKMYVNFENQFPVDDNFEVVLIGSSDISTIRQTHSHYFGIEKFDNILENLDQSIFGLKTRMDIDVGSRQILSVLQIKNHWGRNTVSIGTLRNHFAKKVVTFDASLKTLRDLGLVNMKDYQSPISLNIKRKSDIEAYL